MPLLLRWVVLAEGLKDLSRRVFSPNLKEEIPDVLAPFSIIWVLMVAFARYVKDNMIVAV